MVETALMLLGYANAEWGQAKSYFDPPDRFLERMRAFDASRSCSRVQYQKLCRSGLNRTAGDAAYTDTACAALARWCRTVGDLLAARFGPQDAATRAPSATRSSPDARRPDEGAASRSECREDPLNVTVDPQTVELRPAERPAEQEVAPPSPLAAVERMPDGIDVEPDVYGMSEKELRTVRDLTVRKPGVGQVQFHGEIDLIRERRVLEELPRIVTLKPGEVVLYPEPGTKPPEGEGLNRPATITLFQCAPPNNGVFKDESSKQRYRDRIAKMTEDKGAKFVDYDCERGIWQFRVDHF